MKRILIWGAGAALCMIALPLLLLSLTVGYDAVAMLLLLLLAVNPLFFILFGVQVGFDPPKTWWMPCAAALLFPLCYWMALREVVWNLYLYAVLYLVLAAAAALPTALVRYALALRKNQNSEKSPYRCAFS